MYLHKYHKYDMYVCVCVCCHSFMRAPPPIQQVQTGLSVSLLLHETLSIHSGCDMHIGADGAGVGWLAVGRAHAHR